MSPETDKEILKIIDEILDEAVKKVKQKTCRDIGIACWFKNQVVKKPDG